MRRTFLNSALAVALVATAGCAQTFDATTLGVPATLASDNGAAPQGTAFKVNAKALWAAWGLMPVSQPVLGKTLAAQLVGGKSVANVRIHTHTSILDGIITLGTFGVLAPRSVTYEGVIVEAPAAP
ncbi:MAG: hypothetical protein JF590_05265 [Gemmatimonadetes bacterium]|nr:hypothetical protein [Gemmatimonadota bacterium]